MRTLFTFLVVISWTFPSAGQKVRYVGDELAFLCKGDSLDHIFLEKLKQQGVDTTITALYDFDNGRVEHSKHNIFWTHNGVSWLRTFSGCDTISGDTTRKVDMKEILAYIDTTKFKEMGAPIETDVLISHNMGYFISILLPKIEVDINVRDYQRSQMSGNEKALSDSRVILTNLIASLLKRSTSANK